MNIITKLNIRQKIMLALTILAAAFLAWQIYNFVHGNTAPSKPLPMAPASSVPMPPVAAAGVPQPPVVQPLPVNSSLALAAHQQQYLDLVREYQITKMKRQVMEEEASLANAQKRIADAGKSGAFLGVDTFAGSESFASGDYQLAYLDRQAGQWTATLAQGNQYKEVHIGTRLGDGSRVIAINAKGVVLQPAHGKNVVLGFQGSVNVDNYSVPAATVKAHSSASKKATPVANKLTTTVVKPNNAKIAKMLGITAVSKGTKSTTDIPAAPLANGLPATPAPAVAAPEVTPSSAPVADSASAAVAAPSTTTSAPTTDAASATSAPEAATDTAPSAAAPQVTPDTASSQPPQATPTPVATDAAPDQQPSEAPAQTAPTVKPVSVKELREHNASEAVKMPGQEVALGQISWQQAADLSAAASNK